MPVIEQVDLVGRILFFRLPGPESSERKCSSCGCSDYDACMTSDGPCWWVAVDLCSACARKQDDFWVVIGSRVMVGYDNKGA